MASSNPSSNLCMACGAATEYRQDGKQCLLTTLVEAKQLRGELAFTHLGSLQGEFANMRLEHAGPISVAISLRVSVR